MNLYFNELGCVWDSDNMGETPLLEIDPENSASNWEEILEKMVKACNNHDELVEALKSAISDLEDFIGDYTAISPEYEQSVKKYSVVAFNAEA